MAQVKLDNPILLGVVGAAHGIRGEVRVRAFTQNPVDLGAYGPLSDAAGRRFTVRSARTQKNVVVVAFAEVQDRNAAEALNGTELFVDRSVLPEETEEDEFYEADLVGLEAVSLEDGASLGTIVGLHDFGAGGLIELRPERGPTVMIPFSLAAVPEVDLANRRVRVEPVAAGLKDAILVREGEGDAGDASGSAPA